MSTNENELIPFLSDRMQIEVTTHYVSIPRVGNEKLIGTVSALGWRDRLVYWQKESMDGYQSASESESITGRIVTLPTQNSKRQDILTKNGLRFSKYTNESQISAEYPKHLTAALTAALSTVPPHVLLKSMLILDCISTEIFDHKFMPLMAFNDLWGNEDDGWPLELDRALKELKDMSRSSSQWLDPVYKQFMLLLSESFTGNKKGSHKSKCITALLHPPSPSSKIPSCDSMHRMSLMNDTLHYCILESIVDGYEKMHEGGNYIF